MDWYHITSKRPWFVCIPIALIVLFSSVQPVHGLVCDGEGRTPLLYEDSDFEGFALRVFLEEYEPLYISDEETFAKRASSICVQEGYRVTLYDRKDHQVVIEGPSQLNLSELGWDDRAYAGMAEMIQTLAQPPSTITTPPSQRPSKPMQDNRDFTAYDKVFWAFSSAQKSEDCAELMESYEHLRSQIRAEDAVPISVMEEYGLGRPVLGEYVRRIIGDIRHRKTAHCSLLTGSQGQADQQKTTHKVERHFSTAMASEDCQVTRSMAIKIANLADTGNVDDIVKKLEVLGEAKEACFVEN